jgi:hypothetical protein
MINFKKFSAHISLVLILLVLFGNFSLAVASANPALPNFSVSEATQVAVNYTDYTITIDVPFGTDVTSIAPTITLSDGTISPASDVAQDFTIPVIYTVTDADGVTQDYIATVNVNPAITLTSISIATPADKLIYTVGDSLDISGLVVTGLYSDDNSLPIDITTNNVSGFDSSAPIVGQVLTITIDSITATYNVDINAAPVATLDSIAITTPATKLSYTVGDTLDISALEVTGTYSDTTKKIETITSANVTDFDSSAPVVGQRLTITVLGKTATYTINVSAPAPAPAPAQSGGGSSSGNSGGGGGGGNSGGGGGSTNRSSGGGGKKVTTQKKVVKPVSKAPAAPAVPKVSGTPAAASATAATATSANIIGAQTLTFTSVLKTGSNGNAVMQLQKSLNAHGYDCGIADGKFRQKTKLAVIKFQVANGLKGDGVVGPRTLAVLNK